MNTSKWPNLVWQKSIEAEQKRGLILSRIGRQRLKQRKSVPGCDHWKLNKFPR